MNNRSRLLVAIVSIVATFAVGILYRGHTQRTKEALLKEDLRTMREAIWKYTEYEQQAPLSLEDVVRADYIYEIPADPVCPTMEWNKHFGERNIILGLRIKRTTGLDNVFSKCRKIGSNGKAYDTW